MYAVLLFTGCATVPQENMQTEEIRESEITVETENISEHESLCETAAPEREPTTEIPPETIPETAEFIPPSGTDDQPTETDTSAETELLSMPELPWNLHTNITDPAAAYILLEIYETVSSAMDAGIYFTDVQEEYWFGIGEEKWYHTASTVKPVYCQYLLDAGVDPDTEITLRHVSRTSTTGKLTWESIGTVFTVGELMEYSIRDSDNQAHRLLYETFGIKDYNRYVAKFGSGGLPMDEIYEWANVTPKKLSRVMVEIHRYGEQNSILIDHMKNTTHNSQIPAGTKYETAHKYGTNGGTDGYHDTAIVYAPERAYVLTIMTKIDPERTKDPDAVFRNAAELCDELHGILFLKEK